MDSVGWALSFSEPVTGLSSTNFVLFNGGLTGSPAITSVSGGGTNWTVKASTGGGEGNLSLYMLDSSGIADTAGNYVAALPVQGPAYAIDHISPAPSKISPNTLLVSDNNVGPAGFQLTTQFNEIMNQAIIPSVTFPVENPAPTLMFGSGLWLDAKTYRASFSVANLGIELDDVDVMIAGAQDAVGNSQLSTTITDLFDIDTLNPVVSSFQVNDGALQRSNVTSLTVTFSEIVALPAAAETAFTLIGPYGAVTLAADLSGSSPTQTIAKLTFTGPATEFTSLKDGKYSLTVLATQVFDLASNGMNGNAMVQVHRLFGDADGNATVNSADFAVFRTMFGLGASIFDFNGDGATDASDFAEFRRRFGITLVP